MNRNATLSVILIALTLFSAGLRAEGEAINVYLPSRAQQHPDVSVELELTLNNLLANRVTLHHADDWNTYLDRIESGQPGVYLAAPHFTAWLVHNYDFQTLKRFEDSLAYSIVSNKSDFDIFELGDLKGKQICTQPPLSLGFLMAKEMLADSSTPPTIAVSRSIEQRLIEQDARCAAFTASEALTTQLERSAPNRYVRLALSKQWANYAVSASPDLSYSTLTELNRAFSARPVARLLAEILNNEVGHPVLVKALRIDYPEELSLMLSAYW